MKLPLILLFFVAAHAMADTAGDNSTKPATSPWLTNEIEHEFSYLPQNPAEKVAVNALPITGEPVLLPIFKVEEISWRKLDRAIAEERRGKLRGAFTLKEGGIILKAVGRKVTSEIKFQFHRELIPAAAGSPRFDLLRFSW